MFSSDVFCFDLLPLVWKNATITRDDIGDHMRTYAEENDLLLHPLRSLIGSYHCTEMAMITPLLKWLCDHGFICTKIVTAFEWKPLTCFAKFVEMCADARRKCDRSPDFAPAADMFKLLANSVSHEISCYILYHSLTSTDTLPPEHNTMRITWIGFALHWRILTNHE